MSERIVVAVAFVVSALPLVFIALRFRAGRNLEAISGYQPDRIRDKSGFGRFVGNYMLAIAGLLVAMAPVFLLADDRVALWATLGMVALMQVPLLRLVLGMSKFYRK
jgi:hypothetical protein